MRLFPAILIVACATAHAQQAGRPGSAALPQVGDRWVYEARDLDRPSNKYQAVVEVQEVGAGRIADVFRTDDIAHVTQAHQPGPFLRAVAPGVANFSPYLLSFQALQVGETWRDVNYRQLWECGVGLIDCTAHARVVGREKVTVPAGTFDAWKIVVTMHMGMAASASGFGELHYWFADEVRRFVKYQSRVRFEIGGHYSWPQPNMEMELLSYTPARK